MQNMRELQRRERGITAFVCRIDGDRIELPAPVVDYFDVPGVRLYLKVQKEVLLACEPTKTSAPALLSDAKLILSGAAMSKLKVEDGDYLAVIERRNAFAFKKITTDLLSAFEPLPTGPTEMCRQVGPLSREKARPRKKKPEQVRTEPMQLGAIPQVVAVETISKNGMVQVKGEARKIVKAQKAPRLNVGREVMVSPKMAGASAPLETTTASFKLPDAALAKLGARPGDTVACVRRGDELVIKKFKVVRKQGRRAAITDRETPLAIVRTMKSNPMPGDALPGLEKKFSRKKLKADVRKFLAGRPTFHAWMARRELGIPESGDKALRKQLIDERVAAQKDDGSWSGDVVQTARHLRELGDLGVAKKSTALTMGAEWLLNRAESAINPGMFFLNDRLVAKQADLYEKRRAILEGRGGGFLGKLRMPNPTKSQKLRLAAGDDVLDGGCGFVIWPTAFVLEALLPLGYEKHPRIQRCIDSLMHGYVYWCECNYQMGAGLHSRRPIPGKKELDEREAACISEYLAGADPNREMDRMRRVGHRTVRGADVYEIALSDHMQPCEVITMRALRYSRSANVRRAASVHLWRFAAIQHAPDGTFGKSYKARHAHMLQVYSYFDSPISHLVIMKSLPWIIGNQNRDGSWGKDGNRDATTLAVVRALIRIRDRLPAGFRPWSVKTRAADCRSVAPRAIRFRVRHGDDKTGVGLNIQ